MGFSICLFCIIFVQVCVAQASQNNGQNAMYAGLAQHSVNARGQQAREMANRVPAVNQFARNVALNNNNLINTANLANSSPNIASINQANANLPTSTSNLVNSDLVNKNIAAQNYANNLASANIGNSEIANRANPNLYNARPDLVNQMYPSTNIVSQTSKNIASPYTPQNAIYRNYGNPNFASSNLGSANSNLAGRIANNLATGLAGTNFNNGNFANSIAPANSALNPNLAGLNFEIGGNPFTVMSGTPGNQPYGLHIVADALEIGGTVSISGKMPLYGTVSLNGNLPTDGVANVNYGCSSQRDL